MTTINHSARVGVITDQAGALSYMGIANVNVAKMVIDDLNDGGGLLGRPVELFVEDSATDDSDRWDRRRQRPKPEGTRMGGANVITRMACGSSGLRMALGTSNRRPSPTPAGSLTTRPSSTACGQSRNN
jgi:Periplasmic binding protein